MSLFAIPRALYTLGLDAFEAVVFCLDHSMAAGKLWDETTGRAADAFTPPEHTPPPIAGYPGFKRSNADGAEQLAEAEAEEEVSEAALIRGYEKLASDPDMHRSRREEALGPYQMVDPFPGIVFDDNFGTIVNEAAMATARVLGEVLGVETALSGGELVGIRQLLDERFTPNPPANGAAGDPGPVAGVGPAAGIQTGNVAPAAGQLTRDELMDAARAARWRARSFGPSGASCWDALAARLENAAIAAPK